MARQYKRKYELTISPVNQNPKIITDLRVKFEITKTLLSYPNLCKLEIYNPNAETLSYLQRKYTNITINAGYEGNVRLLFTGDVRNVFQNRKGVDRILTVYAGDGERAWQNATFNKTFTSSVSIQSVINDVLKTFEGISSGVIEGIPNVKDKLLGQTLSGSSRDILDTFAKEYGFTWSIQNQEVIITPIENPIEGDEAVLITSATGMIGSPTITEIGADVTTLLNPRLTPNRAIKIESVNADVQLGNLFFRNIAKTSGEGVYKIQEVTFKGDSREGDWLSIVKGRRINV